MQTDFLHTLAMADYVLLTTIPQAMVRMAKSAIFVALTVVSMVATADPKT
jgi:hypothetical protein